MTRRRVQVCVGPSSSFPQQDPIPCKRSLNTSLCVFCHPNFVRERDGECGSEVIMRMPQPGPHTRTVRKFRIYPCYLCKSLQIIARHLSFCFFENVELFCDTLYSSIFSFSHPRPVSLWNVNTHIFLLPDKTGLGQVIHCHCCVGIDLQTQVMIVQWRRDHQEYKEHKRRDSFQLYANDPMRVY